MKKILFFATMAMCCTTMILPVQAINLGKDMAKDAATKAGYKESTDQNTLAQIIGTIVKAVLSLTGIIFTVLLVYAGNLWMTARGEQEPIDKARKIITTSVIGLIITLAAYSISSFVVSKVLERTTSQSTDTSSDEKLP